MADTLELVPDDSSATAGDRGTEHVRIAIVGSGFAGIGMAIRLKEAGIEDFVILDRADDVGGTWQANTYPGCQCDVPSHLYSFSFEPNPAWTRTYSRQPEIWEYLRGCAERYGLKDHLRLGHELTAATWDEAQQRWHVSTSRGEFSAALADRRDRAVESPRGARDPRPAALRGQALSLREVGPRPRPDRRARRGDRDGRVGDPVRPADPEAGRPDARLPAHGAVDHAAHRPADLALRAPALPARPGPHSGWCARPSTGRASRTCSASPSARRS